MIREEWTRGVYIGLIGEVKERRVRLSTAGQLVKGRRAKGGLGL